MSLDPDFDRWLHRLPLSERLEIERREAQQDAYRVPKSSINARCSVCGGRLNVEDVRVDRLKRCHTCRGQRRRPVGQAPDGRGTGPRRPRRLR